MSNAKIEINGQPATITTEHATCSYGQPVLILDGQVYGPDDIIAGLDAPAYIVVHNASGRAIDPDEDPSILPTFFGTPVGQHEGARKLCLKFAALSQSEQKSEPPQRLK